MSGLDEFKEVKKHLEKELKLYQAKKDNMETITAEIHAVIDIAEEVKIKADSLKENSSKIDTINSRIEALQQSYSNLDSRISELNENEDLINKSLMSLEKMDIIASSLDKRLGSFQNVADKTERKVEKLKEYLGGIEQNTLILKSKEKEIKDVHDKFNELESLTEHVEARMNQILAMMNKVEKMHDAIDQTDNRLKEMYDKTDKKMKQFSDFIQSMGSSGVISKQMKKDSSVDKNINENVIRTVRELSSKGWDSTDISSKLMIDENTIRLIINTAEM